MGSKEADGNASGRTTLTSMPAKCIGETSEMGSLSRVTSVQLLARADKLGPRIGLRLRRPTQHVGYRAKAYAKLGRPRTNPPLHKSAGENQKEKRTGKRTHRNQDGNVAETYTNSGSAS